MVKATVEGMEPSASTVTVGARPDWGAVLELLKPITWFAPMWAFGCGVVSAGLPLAGRWPEVLAGVILAGPMVCATSQAVNDWFDRHVDAINEPQPADPVGPRARPLGALHRHRLDRPVTARRHRCSVPGASARPWSAWRWPGPTAPRRSASSATAGGATRAVAACYEGLPWFTGAAVLMAGWPGWPIVILAALYSVGAHGIMTLNDFKSVEGDRRMGIGSLPVLLGVDRAARVACLFMALPQLVVIALLVAWGRPFHAVIVAFAAARAGRC